MLRGDGEGAAVRFSLAKAEPLRAELEAFCRCVLDDTPEPVSAHDGVKALAAALAVRESAAVRRPVELLDIPAPRPAGGLPHDPLRHPGLQRGREHPRACSPTSPRWRASSAPA